MAFDAFTISALRDEFHATIVGGRVQAVIDVDDFGIGLEIYAVHSRHYLYLGADASHPRVHLVPAKLRRGLSKPKQLGLLCRRYLQGASLAEISQPPWERIMRFDFQGGEGRASLIAELMPRRANLLLVADGLILDCLRRVGPDQNRYRLSLPNHEYLPPPPLNDQIDPRDVSPDALADMLAQVSKPSTPAFRVLPRRILGISPALAKEIVFRASGDARTAVGDTDPSALRHAMRDLLAPMLRREWKPGISLVHGVPSDFSACPLRQTDWQPSDSMSAAIAAFHSALSDPDAYAPAREPVAVAISQARAKLSKKIASLERGLRDGAEMEKLRQSGELILAYQYSITDGQTELCAQYHLDEPELVIPLDPRLSPLENAQTRFRQYEKAKSASAALPALIAEAENEMRYIDQLELDLRGAANWLEIDDVVQALQARGHWTGERRRRMGGGRQGPMRVVTPDGYVVWVGRNSRQNAQLLSKTAKPRDLWLHARNAAGAHVVIRDDGRRISEDLIAKAAAVAAWHSSRRGDSRVAVDYARVRHVRALKGAGPGLVTYRNETTIQVEPAEASILR